MSAFSNSFMQSHNIDTSIQELWNIFKAQCENSLNSISTKSLSGSTKHTWITSGIKCLSNKKKRLYNKARLSNSETDWFAYKEIKKLAQRESRNQCGIPSLEKDNQTITDSFCKATIFTDANPTPTVTLEENTFPHIPPVNIMTEGVLQLLQELDPHKASGPDGIPSKFLKGNLCQHSPLSDTHISSFVTSRRTSHRLEEDICNTSVQEKSAYQSI